MKFKTLNIKTNTYGADVISGILLIEGISSFSITDPNDFIEVLENKSIPVDYYDEGLIPEDMSEVMVTVYLPENNQGAGQGKFIINEIEKLKMLNGTELGTLDIVTGETDDKDWENNWRQYFHPIEIGEKFIIKPSWEECDPGDRHVLEIDPESSFGTGQHETTRLCLELLEKTDLTGKTVLDMGCGSGILGIGTALLGAGSVTAVDIDENAAGIADKNFKCNGINSGYRVLWGNVLIDEIFNKTVFDRGYDVIMANIAADILVGMMPGFSAALNSGGRIVLSGIIKDKKSVVETVLEEYGFSWKSTEENDWVAILAYKN